MRALIFLLALSMCAAIPSIASAEVRSYATQNVVKALQSQFPQLTSDSSFTYCAAIVASRYHAKYSILPWRTLNEGGQALFKYNSSKGWVLLSGGGGAWTASSLVNDKGVPQAIAEQLVKELKHSCKR